MRDANCPICRQATDVELRLRFGPKFQLPTEVELRHCPGDNFLFIGGGAQSDYDRYYANVVNDSCHREVSSGEVRSPISKLQQEHLAAALDGFFDSPRRVLDFGCGGASLLLELATAFPASAFYGFDPGPAAREASAKAHALGLNNLSIAGLEESIRGGPYDLVIVSHVLEHLLDLDLLDLLRSLVSDSGLLYVEVPDSQHYECHERLEFLYYFDRLHVNHFSPQSLARLAAAYGFGHCKHFEYAFPYRDGGSYPALGMLFRKGGDAAGVPSISLIDGAQRYMGREKERAHALAARLNAFDGVLVWGAGDNFYRSCENGGPLSDLRNMVLLDRRSQEVMVGDRLYKTIEPQAGLQSYPWPVVVTVSESRDDIGRLIDGIDAERPRFFI